MIFQKTMLCAKEPVTDGLPAGTSTGRFMLAVLGGLADVEGDLIRTRTAEGRSRAKAQRSADGPTPGTNFGATDRGHLTPRGGRYARRTRPQLQRRHIHRSPRDADGVKKQRQGRASLHPLCPN